MDIKLSDKESLNVYVTKNDGIYEYYLSDIKIGVYDPKVMEDNILIIENTIDNELSATIKDQINAMDKEDIEFEADLNVKLEKIAEEMGIKKVKRTTTLELIEEKEKEDEEELEELDEKDLNEEEKDEEEEETEELDRTNINDVNVKQEISLSERANDMQDLRKWLGSKVPPEFTKVVVIEGSDMSKMTNENGENYKNTSTRYALAVVDKNGNVEPLQKFIPQLRQRSSSGNNPTELSYQVDESGKVEKDAVLSEYEIGNKILQIDNKEMGRVELNVGQKEHGGNDTVSVQMRDSNSTFATSKETRSVIGEYESNGQYVVNEDLKEAKQHEDGDCDELTQEDIDGDPTTQSHNHIDEETDFNELATKWGLYRDGRPDGDRAKEILVEEMEKNPDKTQEEVIEETTEQMEEDFRSPEQKR